MHLIRPSTSILAVSLVLVGVASVWTTRAQAQRSSASESSTSEERQVAAEREPSPAEIGVAPPPATGLLFEPPGELPPLPGAEAQASKVTRSTATEPSPKAAATKTSEPSKQQGGGRQEGGRRGGPGGGPGGEGDAAPKPARPGIPITNELVRKHCVACHVIDDDGMMSRLSYMRKTPEGWELSLKRMLRFKHVPELTPDEAKEIVRYLANDHGLARAEAEEAMYEVERRVHWSEEEYSQDLRDTCAECHTLGRVLSERRDKKEWTLLKATHLAYFPLADFQAFRGSRRRGTQPDFASMTAAERDAFREQMSRTPSQDRADRVLSELAKNYPLVTPEWEAWEVNRREIPLAGTWTVVGHEVGRGDIRGEVEIKRVSEDTYDTRWEISYGGEAQVVRKGQAVHYAGYSWRGRSTTMAPGEPASLREVLLLDEDWNTFEGRLFTGEYNELGADVTLYRQSESPTIFTTLRGAAAIPSTGHRLEVIGSGFPKKPKASDFHLGAGVTVTAVDRVDADSVTLVVNVDRSAEPGTRVVSYGATRGPRAMLLYDTIDYIKITPGEGFARIGGKMRPKQLERFEALAMNRGPDGKPYTDDDVEIKVVPARWQIEEFPIRENDDDAMFVGSIDESTGVFVPGLDGPNPERRWNANNIGDVYVVATTNLRIRELPTEEPAGDVEPPIVWVEKEFRARGHLLVTVPLYIRWDRYEWDQR